MFVKAIRFKDVRPGDVVCVNRGETEEMLSVVPQESHSGSRIALVGRVGATYYGNPDQLIGLVHRPDPLGRDEERARTSLTFHVSRLIAATAPFSQARFDEAVGALHRESENYLLAKPPKDSQEKPKPNESLIDKHLTW